MFKRIGVAALVGWTGIIALAWWLASKRIELCGYGEHTCEIRAAAARDYILIVGLTVALVAALGTALIRAFIFARNGNGGALIVEAPARTGTLPVRALMQSAATSVRSRLGARLAASGFLWWVSGVLLTVALIWWGAATGPSRTIM